jgi:hypothetical protein
VGVSEQSAEENIWTKRDEMTGGWRKLHNEEFRVLYFSSSIIRIIKSKMMRWEGHVEGMGRRETRVGYWWESQKGRRPLGRPRRTWVDNIKVDIGEVGCGHVDWIGLAQDTDKWRSLVNAVKNLRVP